MNFLMNMKALMTWIILWYFKINLSHTEFLMIEQSKVSNRKILETFKVATITECWLKCKKTADCKDIGTVTDKNKKTITCHLLASDEIEFENEEILYELNRIHSVTVSFFSFWVFYLLKVLRTFFEAF